MKSSTVLPSRFLTFSLSLFSLPRGTDILYSHFFSLFQPVLKLCTVLLSHFLSLFLTSSLSLRSTDILYSHFFSCFLTFHDHIVSSNLYYVFGVLFSLFIPILSGRSRKCPFFVQNPQKLKREVCGGSHNITLDQMVRVPKCMPKCSQNADSSFVGSDFR